LRNRGYRLESSPNVLVPMEFPRMKYRIKHSLSVDSTMRVARQQAQRGAPAGIVVVAEEQTAGRGRLGRHWESPPGGIYLTIITRPRIAPAQAARINLLVGVVVSRTLESLYGLPARVKWPNDVLIYGKKVCGILAEMEAECDVVRFVNVGIGLNANSRVAENQPNGVSLLELLGEPVDRVLLVRQLLDAVFDALPQLASDAMLDDWRARTMTLGREVSIVSGASDVHGVALDVTASGALLVRDAGGQIHEVMAGDCLHQGY